MHAVEIHPEIGVLVAGARIRLAEVSTGQAWESMSARERLEVIGWLGFTESAIMLWIEEGMLDSELIADVLVDTARSRSTRPETYASRFP